MSRARNLSLFPWGLLLAAGGCYHFGQLPLERQPVTRDTHVFPLTAGAHAAAACDDCHGEFETFTQYTCISCHEHAEAATTPLHVGIADYQYSATSCYDCHPTGEGMRREDHTAFPVLEGAHGQVGCAECHLSGFSGFTCIDCHAHRCSASDAAHAGVGGYQCASSACLSCHPDGKVMTPAAHAPLFPITSPPHAYSCNTCHASGFGSFQCITCHEHTCSQTNADHDEVSGYSCVSTRCLDCHPTGRE
jgi:hypothetical protein